MQVILGMINYLRRFVPGLAEMTAPMQMLIKKQTEWLWTQKHENNFVKIKNCVSRPYLFNFLIFIITKF